MIDGKLVLIVDDNPAEREIFSTFLRFVGGRVVEAGDGEEGLRMVERHWPSLILLDLSMPRMDGWEMMRRLNENPTTAAIPVIALTAHRLDRLEMSQAGFCGYLEKPMAPVHVLSEIEASIGSVAGGWFSREGPAPLRATEPSRPAAVRRRPAMEDGMSSR